MFVPHDFAGNFVVRLFFFFETMSFYIDQAGVKLEILLPQLPECWDLQICTTMSSLCHGLSTNYLSS
jgi:hypothetical protein